MFNYRFIHFFIEFSRYLLSINSYYQKFYFQLNCFYLFFLHRVSSFFQTNLIISFSFFLNLASLPTSSFGFSSRFSYLVYVHGSGQLNSSNFGVVCSTFQDIQVFYHDSHNLPVHHLHFLSVRLMSESYLVCCRSWNS